jgi:hypothetical protein
LPLTHRDVRGYCQLHDGAIQASSGVAFGLSGSPV